MILQSITLGHMNAARKVVYNGDTYWINSAGRYYCRDGSRSKRERLLHRVKWIDKNGPIPNGMCIHHKNGNWLDNRISNLELMDSGDHCRMHMAEVYKDPIFRKENVRHLNKIRPLTLKWHGSKEGIEWHRQHGKNCWIGKKPKPCKCEACGKIFHSLSPCIARFCSYRCRRKIYWYSSYEPRKCCVCGGDFRCNRYSKATHCSQTCKNHTMWKTRKRNTN